MSKVTNQVEMNLDGIFLADRDNEGPEKNETMSVHQRVSYIPLQELGRCEAWRTTAQTIVEFMDSRTGLVRQPQAEKMLSSETRIEKDPGLDEEVSECVEGTVVSEIQTQVRRHLENMGLNSCQNLEPQFRIEAALERMLAVLKTLDRAAEPRPLAKATTSNLDDSGLHCTFENKSYGTTQRQYGHKLYVPKTRSISVSGWSGTESSFSGMPGAATSSTGISTHSTRSPLSSISFCSDYQLPISPGSLSNRAHSLIGARGFLPETLGPDFLPCNSQPHTLDPAKIRKRSNPKRFFVVGRVFRMLWTEPSDDTNRARSEGSADFFTGRNDQLYYSKYRLFIVVRASDNYCNAVEVLTLEGSPITSYSNSGAIHSKLVKTEHGVVYTGKNVPTIDAAENGMQGIPIKVEPDDRFDKLSPKSRINYGKQQTVEHYAKVQNFGMVAKEHRSDLVDQARRVQWGIAPSVGSECFPAAA